MIRDPPTHPPTAKSQNAYSPTDSTLDKDSETATKLAAPNSTHPKSPTLQLPPQQHRQHILIDRLYICDRTQPRTNFAQLVSPIVCACLKKSCKISGVIKGSAIEFNDSRYSPSCKINICKHSPSNRQTSSTPSAA